jgi:hypothetical protein
MADASARAPGTRALASAPAKLSAETGRGPGVIQGTGRGPDAPRSPSLAQTGRDPAALRAWSRLRVAGK